MNYAVIENGVVTNIAVWDGESAWQPTNALVIPVSDNVRIGWFYDKGKLSSPTQPPKHMMNYFVRQRMKDSVCWIVLIV